MSWCRFKRQDNPHHVSARRQLGSDFKYLSSWMGQKTFTVIAASSGLCRVELESGRICGLENGDVLPFRPPWLLLNPKFLR